MKKILAGLTIVISIALASCGGGSGFRHGQTVIVNERCIWASDKDAYKEMCKLCNREDEFGLERMEAQGKVGILEEGETGTVTGMDFETVQIRTVDGKEVLVASKFLK